MSLKVATTHVHEAKLYFELFAVAVSVFAVFAVFVKRSARQRLLVVDHQFEQFFFVQRLKFRWNQRPVVVHDANAKGPREPRSQGHEIVHSTVVFEEDKGPASFPAASPAPFAATNVVVEHRTVWCVVVLVSTAV